MQCEICVAARWWNYIFLTQKLEQVRIYLVHSSLLNHTEQAYHPKPKKRKEKEELLLLRDFGGFDQNLLVSRSYLWEPAQLAARTHSINSETQGSMLSYVDKFAAFL